MRITPSNGQCIEWFYKISKVLEFVKIETHTRKQHSLSVDEFNTLVLKDFEEPTLNLARDMFVIATLGGGLRPGELFNGQLKVTDNFIHIYRTKLKEWTTNPIIGPLNNVISSHNGLPEFLDEVRYRKALKKIAQLLSYDRVISWVDNSVNTKGTIVSKTVKELFNAYFARKTCVTMLDHWGLTEDQIIEFTGHNDRKSLNITNPKCPLSKR